MLSCTRRLALWLLAVASPAVAQTFAADSVPWKSIKAPSGWNISLFAAPPNVGYPTCLSTAPNGDLYVGVDENGSIDAKPNRGRVVQCTDTDGDGTADRFVTFATMDSPRGLWFDDNVLYVQHPPFVTAFTDDDGDGKSDRSRVLVRGLGFDLKFRGADHTVNGMRMGIDGFLYIAVGDYGATNALGTDGRSIKLHGGGVVRVRPDGTGLEIVSRGQRNIYDVAVSPELDLFTRDNTNDGDGWDVRLSHVIFGGQYGYPTLYKHFSDETMAPLADYGGGSPCGALFMDEPGFPKEFGRALYTVEWGRSAIYRHPLTPGGASFGAGQEKFIDVSRPTDMDVDGSGRLFVSSWHGATFTYNGPNAGFVVQVTPPGWSRRAFPDLKKASVDELLQTIGSTSAFARLYAQRELLRRGVNSTAAAALEQVAAADGAAPSRVAAIFTLRQLLGINSHPALLRLTGKSAVREFALRALADDLREASLVPVPTFVTGLKDTDPRVRLQAATALGRIGGELGIDSDAPGVRPDWKEATRELLAVTADTDLAVAHVAVNSLVQLRAASLSLAAFDSASTSAYQRGAARVLQALHEPGVVHGLIDRLGHATYVTSRRLLIGALARLYNREDEWNGRWWGTRPDSTGPYFKPVTWSGSARIAEALRNEIATASGDDLKWLAVTLQRNRVDLPEMTETVLKLAARDPQFRSVAVDLFAGRSAIPTNAIPLFTAIASGADQAPGLRAKALRALLRSSRDTNAVEGALIAAISFVTEKSQADLNAAWEEYARFGPHGWQIARFQSLAASGSPAERTVAYGVLASLATGRLVSRETKSAANGAIERAWTDDASAVPLLTAIARLRIDAYAHQVRGLAEDARGEVANAAREAASQMGLRNTGSSGRAIEAMKYDEVLAGVAGQKVDVRRGRELFMRAGCVACHTTSADEPPKGPFLGGIATRYSRAELCESILKPAEKVAQGFETQWFQLRDGDELEGFVTREGGEDVDVRNILGITTTVAKKDIAERMKRETSMMPAGLLDKLSVSDLAALLSYLESLKSN
jgi:putative heme-binding domain-containing protein